jgi:hypothetical protein
MISLTNSDVVLTSKMNENIFFQKDNDFKYVKNL